MRDMAFIKIHAKHKKHMKSNIFAAVIFVAASFCTATQAEARRHQVLADGRGWTIDTVATGVVYYHFSGYDDVSAARQNVDVLALSKKSPYGLRFVYTQQGDSLSGVVARQRAAGHDVVGGINGAYEPEAVYIRVDGKNISEVTLPAGHLRFWKHEGAVMLMPGGKPALAFASRKDGTKAIASYKKSRATDILASAPMLIDRYKPVGTTFVEERYRDWTTAQFETLDYEDKNRHQGVRHPRTAVAKTADGTVLLITVDGRRAGFSEGMSAAELTRFIERHFRPRYALNMDGGGSTTMVVKGRGQKETGVVNYPTDNKRQDHWGQRTVGTFLLVERQK